MIGGEQAQQAASGGPGAEQTAPYGIWWYVMLLLVLAAAVAESVFSGQYLGTQREGP